MYAPDGSWYVVVIRNATKALDVVWMHDGERSMLGRAMPVGDVSTLYLPKSHRMDTLALMDGDRVVAHGHAYSAKNGSSSSRWSIRVAGGSADENRLAVTRGCGAAVEQRDERRDRCCCG